MSTSVWTAGKLNICCLLITESDLEDDLEVVKIDRSVKVV